MYIQICIILSIILRVGGGNLAYQYLTRYDPALLDLHIILAIESIFLIKLTKMINLTKMLISEHRMRICNSDK
jgi:hypothetical protein